MTRSPEKSDSKKLEVGDNKVVRFGVDGNDSKES